MVCKPRRVNREWQRAFSFAVVLHDTHCSSRQSSRLERLVTFLGPLGGGLPVESLASPPLAITMVRGLQDGEDVSFAVFSIAS